MISQKDIIGIIFTVHDTSLGTQFCFRYPPVVRDGLSAETRRALENQDPSDDTLQVYAPGYDHTITDTKYSGFKSPSVLLNTLLCPHSIRDEPLEIILDDVRFVCYPASLKDKDEQANTTTKSSDGNELTLFNIVIATSPEMDSGKTKTCAHIAQIIANALVHEQKRCNYVSTEIAKMLRVRQAWLEKQKNIDPTKRPGHVELYDNIMKASPLSVTLEKIFYGLQDQGIVNIKINSWVSVYMTLNDSEDPTYPAHEPLRPYKALLLLEDKKELLESLPKGASPALRQVIEIATPMHSMQRLQEQTGHPLSLLYRLVLHLVYWKKAKIVDDLVMDNILILNPNPPGEHFPFLATKFAQVFPEFRLSEILHRFSFPVKLSQQVQHLAPQSKNRFLEVLIWLMKRGLVMQIHKFLYLNIPLPQNYLAQDEGGEATSDSDYKPLDGKHPTTKKRDFKLRTYERDYIDSIADASALYKTLLRMLPYCRGMHHVVEIQWRTGLESKSIYNVLRNYSDILVVCQHE